MRMYSWDSISNNLITIKPKYTTHEEKTDPGDCLIKNANTKLFLTITHC